MKKTEIATIIFVASLSMLATYFIANTFIGQKAKLVTTIKTAESLPALPDEVTLSKQFFNKDALNPTVEIYVESDNSSSNTSENSLSSSKPADATKTQQSSDDQTDAASSDTGTNSTATTNSSGNKQ